MCTGGIEESLGLQVGALGYRLLQPIDLYTTLDSLVPVHCTSTCWIKYRAYRLGLQPVDLYLEHTVQGLY